MCNYTLFKAQRLSININQKSNNRLKMRKACKSKDIMFNAIGVYKH